MNSDLRQAGRWRPARADLWPALLLGALAFLLFGFAGAKPTLIGINSDGAIYALMADVYSPYRNGAIGFAEHLFASYPFPPLYPLLLGLLGGGTASPLLDYFIGAAQLGVAVACIYAWVRRAGGSGVAAFACAAGFALSPSALLLAMGVFSEPLYLALSMSAFAILAASRKDAWHWYAAAALFGLSALARTVGLFAIAAFLIHWWSCTRGRRYRLTPAVALVPALTWSVIKYLRDWHTSYTASLLDAGLATLVRELLQQMPINARALWYYAVRTFDLLGSTYSAIACVMLLLLAGLSLLPRLRALEADALYVVLYTGVLLLWPYPNHTGRFLLMLLPFVLAYAVWGAGLLVRSAGADRLVRVIEPGIALVMACIILPSTFLITRQILQFSSGAEAAMVRTASWYGRDSQAEARATFEFGRQVLEAMGAMAPHVPPDSCVTSTMPEMVLLWTRRLSLRPPDADAGPVAMHAALARCPYVLMLRATAFPAVGYPPYYPLTEVGPYLRIVHTVPSASPSSRDRPLAMLARYLPPAAGEAGATSEERP